MWVKSGGKILLNTPPHPAINFPTMDLGFGGPKFLNVASTIVAKSYSDFVGLFPCPRSVTITFETGRAYSQLCRRKLWRLECGTHLWHAWFVERALQSQRDIEIPVNSTKTGSQRVQIRVSIVSLTLFVSSYNLSL